MQSFDIKECNLMELEITQIKHHLSILGGKCLSSTPHKNENIFMKCAQNRRCISSMREKSSYEV